MVLNEKNYAPSSGKLSFGKRGSAAVLILIFMISMVSAAGIIFEMSERRAAETIAENAVEIAAQTELSDYDLSLFERYGIFGLEENETNINKNLQRMINQSLKSMNIPALSLNETDVDVSDYSLAIPDVLLVQIKHLAPLAGLVNNADSFIEAVSGMAEGLTEETSLEERIASGESEMEAAEAAQQEAQKDENHDSSGDIDFQSIRAAHSQLKSVRSSAEEDNTSANQDRVLRNGRILDSLPSTVNGVKTGGSSIVTELYDFIFKSGNRKKDLLESFEIDEYALCYFRNHLSENSEAGEEVNFFQNEIEYILYGNRSDLKNYRQAYTSLKAMRTAINTAYLLTDSGKRSLINEAAAVLTPGPFAPLTGLLITAAWASLEAVNDMRNLEAGNDVPLIKTSSTWMTDISAVLSGTLTDGYIKIPSNSIMTYEYYLRILMMSEDRDTKLYRIMDLMQINLKGSERQEFLMADHYSGFDISSEFKKKSRVSFVPSTSIFGEVSRAYLTEDES